MTKQRDDCSQCLNTQPARDGCWLCGGNGIEPTTVILKVAARDQRPGDRMISTRGVLTVTDVQMTEIDTGLGRIRDTVHVRYNGEQPVNVANLHPDTPWEVMRCVNETAAKRIARHFQEN